MALIKEKVLENGMSGNYWKITSIAIDRKSGKVSCKLELFKDVSFKTLCSLGVLKTFIFPITSADIISNNIILYCYTAIKAKNDPDLVNAINA